MKLHSTCAECGSRRKHFKGCKNSTARRVPIVVNPQVSGIDSLTLRNQVLNIYQAFASEDRVPLFKDFLVRTAATVRELEETIAWLQREKKLPLDVGL